MQTYMLNIELLKNSKQWEKPYKIRSRVKYLKRDLIRLQEQAKVNTKINYLSKLEHYFKQLKVKN